VVVGATTAFFMGLIAIVNTTSSGWSPFDAPKLGYMATPWGLSL